MAHLPRIPSHILHMTTRRVILLALLVAINLTMVCGGHMHEGHLSSAHLAIFGEPHIHLDNDTDHESLTTDSAQHETDPDSDEHTSSSESLKISLQEAGSTWVSSSAGEITLLSMLGVALFLDFWRTTSYGAWIHLLTITRASHIASAPEPPPPRS